MPVQRVEFLIRFAPISALRKFFSKNHHSAATLDVCSPRGRPYALSVPRVSKSLCMLCCACSRLPPHAVLPSVVCGARMTFIQLRVH